MVDNMVFYSVSHSFRDCFIQPPIKELITLVHRAPPCGTVGLSGFFTLWHRDLRFSISVLNGGAPGGSVIVSACAVGFGQEFQPLQSSMDSCISLC